MHAAYQNDDKHDQELPFGRLPEEQCEQIHAASLQILERTGVRLYDQEAIDLIKRGGAEVSDGNRARIPRKLVEWALKSAPTEFNLYDRHHQDPLHLRAGQSYYGPGSDCMTIIDHHTNERRLPTRQDVRDGIKLCDALANIDFVMSMFLPSDVDYRLTDRYQMLVMLTETTKPILYVTNDFKGCVEALAMAELVSGGPEAFRAKPTAAGYINVTNGLNHNQEALEKLLYLAGKGVPLLYIPSAMGGIAGPITPAGSVTLANAGVLVGLLLSQLKREGTPFIMTAMAGNALDMRTMVSAYGQPEPKRLAFAMGHYYDLPMFGIGGCSNSKLVDQQATSEAALTLMSDTLGGATLIHDIGYLESGLCGSLAYLVICEEMVSWIKKMTAPVEIDPETLSVDLIDAVGPDGQFLDSEHTFKHFRKRWYPQLFDYRSYDQWQAVGGYSLGDRASQAVDRIIGEHRPDPLPDTLIDELQARLDVPEDAPRPI
ncbi:MAG: trimethylamine methyltransferase family protein [Anaerolineales bacterium]|nr:trimethylamine methyltransferase family protein [Anaerolineales bacterium]